MEISTLDGIVFYVACALALLGGVIVVGQKNPTYSAFGLIGTLCSMSVLFGLLASPFLAALQVIVYAGAIMVLFLFVMMLLNVRSEETPAGGGGTLRVVAFGLVAVLVAEVGTVLLRATRDAALPEGVDFSIPRFAQVLFGTEYVYVFEATSVLILAALVGAVALSRRERP